MRPGDTIGDRFEIAALAGSGGMGAVYRARDRRGGMVAVKVLHDPRDEARFAREADVLASLRHPAIVGYVAHGTTGAGEAYLVTEWLEGETLAERLRRGRLSIAESLDLGARVAEALGAAHRAGVVHRDLKPGNLFLQGGELSLVRVLDFGIARAPDAGRPLTMTGVILGTIGYMSPEQARGERGVGPPADVFSLGCVLFKCIAGEAPFTAEDPLAMLVKVALEDAPRLGDVREDVPPALEDLVAAMLAKPIDERPRDGDAVARALRALGEGAGAAPASRRLDPLPEARMRREQRVMSMVLVRSPADAPPDEETQPIAATETRQRALAAAVNRHRGRLHFLADGSTVITFSSEGEANDLAACAARGALAVRPLMGAAPIAVVSGRGLVSAALAVGELIERALALLKQRPPPGVREAIRVDDATAGLLGAAFDVAGEGGLLWLHEERERPGAARSRILGRPTTCLGREQELSTLESLFAECAAEPVARAVLITGEAGMGKSRLVRELLARVRARAGDVAVWEARGDPIGQGSSFGLIAQIIRQAAGFSAAEPLEARRQKLRERAARSLPAADVARVSELLGELAGAEVPDDEASPELRGARREPLGIGDRLRRAWEAFLEAECAVRPVVLAIEDLHWGDLPTVTFVDAALRDLEARPLFVLATARPEVHAAFPRLWAAREAQELRLPKLTRRAGERLVREVLGVEAGAEAVASIVERADGNAFFLEELIRAAIEGRTSALPATVVAMVQSRIERMTLAARRALRAGSVFGQTFWQGGVEALLGEPCGPALAELVAAEAISPPREGRFPGEAEHAFRHALVREAADATLAPGDRALAHRLAGEWLEAAGETDARVLAEHFERGGEAGRAAAFHQRASAQALRGNDLEAAIDRAERGLAHGTGELRASLLMILLEAYAWRNEWTKTAAYADEVFRREPPGSRAWCMAAMGKVWSASVLERPSDLLEAMLALGGIVPAPDAVAAAVQAESAVAMTMTIGGMYDQAAASLDRMERIGGPAEAAEPVVRGWLELTRGFRVRQVEGDVFASLRRMRSAAASFERGGAPQQALWASVHVGIALWLLGAHEEARRALEGALREPAAGDRLRVVASVGTYVLANVLGDEGRLDDAREAARRMIRAEEAQGNRYLEGLGRITLSRISLARGDVGAAAEEASTAIGLLELVPYDRAVALAALAAARLAEGRIDDAVRDAREAYQQIERTPGYTDAAIRLVHAEALAAAGDPGAGAALGEARERLLERAEKIGDPVLRASFLERVPENARTLARGQGT
jgi:tetratricopeptide (TPR) repeat protein